jgi:4,5-DOPA dioxygenase extradiol
MTKPMPAIFFGHGNPMNALARNPWTAGWSAIGSEIRRPRAILCVSAHWYLPATLVSTVEAPRTIHDFGGFPRELYEINYPAPGSPALAGRVIELLGPESVRADQSWGLDHGTWSVLVHVNPQADIPVVQLSIDETQPAEFHYELAKRLIPLRDEDVLIMGSGNVVHNLHAYAWGRHVPEPLDWAARFETLVREKVLSGDDADLVFYERLGRDAMLSAPTPDHYLPLLYVLAQRTENDEISFPVEGFDGGSISMLSIQVG